MGMTIQFGDSRIPARFWDRIAPEPMTGCWLWTASIKPGGYGQAFLSSHGVCLAHRATYETLVEPVPAGLDLDHLCRNRSCCNPHHLEPVTRSGNLKRGKVGDKNVGQRRKLQLAERTTCRRGHPYDDANVVRHTNGIQYRICRTCSDIAYRNRQARKAAAKRTSDGADTMK